MRHTADTTYTLIQGWIPSAHHVVSPNYNARPAEAEPNLIVVHNISLPPGEFGGGYINALFTNCLDPAVHPYFAEICDLRVSSHFLISRGGELTQYVATDDRAWHAGHSEWCGRGNCNDFSIGIELEGTDDEPYAEEQYAVLVQLIDLLQREYPSIAADAIVGHSDIAPGRKTDPGPAFDWPKLWAQLRLERSQQGRAT
ncbi:N-acetylmuramoyl-L-alanine amidase, family 2 [Luminiphilus syltensis NOR5-1B]|uniref:1,6-anhydro-N-acetylmuramyl-L-alanine amidase AmpD n=1 Tax=Luminiphilus syltensis NOR5-1B TaxID=565045 RepID=B8KQP0_9GAMM|nr:N-acetylmuramoyl-L-alanine amidase, family 2 [Luminiphilus syltensis NOR5-1B]